MYAIIEDRGKQHRAEKGKLLKIDFKDNLEKGVKVEFDKILLVSDNGDTKIGQPYVSNVKVVSEVVEPRKRGKKIRVFRYQRREGYHKEKGFKPQFTIVKVLDILKD